MGAHPGGLTDFGPPSPRTHSNCFFIVGFEDPCVARCYRLHDRSLGRADMARVGLTTLLDRQKPAGRLRDACWRLYDLFDCMKHCDEEPKGFEKFIKYSERQCLEAMHDMDAELHCISKYHTFMEVRCSSFMKEAVKLRRRIGIKFTPDQDTCRYVHLNALCLENAVLSHCPNAEHIFTRLNFRDYFLNFIVPDDDTLFDDEDLDACQVYDFVQPVFPKNTKQPKDRSLSNLYSPTPSTSTVAARFLESSTFIEEELERLEQHERSEFVTEQELETSTKASSSSPDHPAKNQDDLTDLKGELEKLDKLEEADATTKSSKRPRSTTLFPTLTPRIHYTAKDLKARQKNRNRNRGKARDDDGGRGDDHGKAIEGVSDVMKDQKERQEEKEKEKESKEKDEEDDKKKKKKKEDEKPSNETMLADNSTLPLKPVYGKEVEITEIYTEATTTKTTTVLVPKNEPQATPSPRSTVVTSLSTAQSAPKYGSEVVIPSSTGADRTSTVTPKPTPVRPYLLPTDAAETVMIGRDSELPEVAPADVSAVELLPTAKDGENGAFHTETSTNRQEFGDDQRVEDFTEIPIAKTTRKKLFSSDEDFEITPPNFHYSTYRIGLIPKEHQWWYYTTNWANSGPTPYPMTTQKPVTRLYTTIETYLKNGVTTRRIVVKKGPRKFKDPMEVEIAGKSDEKLEAVEATTVKHQPILDRKSSESPSAATPLFQNRKIHIKQIRPMNERSSETRAEEGGRSQASIIYDQNRQQEIDGLLDAPDYEYLPEDGKSLDHYPEHPAIIPTVIIAKSRELHEELQAHPKDAGIGRSIDPHKLFKNPPGNSNSGEKEGDSTPTITGNGGDLIRQPIDTGATRTLILVYGILIVCTLLVVLLLLVCCLVRKVRQSSRSSGKGTPPAAPR
ncbi:unnamed protein product, partial [Mesorhabditis spiculigera]